MASSAARGLSRGRSSGSGRSASPSWNEGRSSRNRVSRDSDPAAGNNTPAGTPSAGSAVDCGGSAYSSAGSWMPGGFEIGDFVTYIGPSYTFPGTGVTLRHGMEGEVRGHGANVPTEYRSHRFLSIRFSGHTGETNVPPDALAPCFRPPTTGPWVGPAHGFEHQPAAAVGALGPQGSFDNPRDCQAVVVKPTKRPEAADGVEDCFMCCAGPETIRGEGDRPPERSSCDIASVLDYLFGDGHPDKSAARSPAIATSEFPHPPSPRPQDLLLRQQQQQQPQLANPAIVGSQARLGDILAGQKREPGSSVSSLIGGQRRAG